MHLRTKFELVLKEACHRLGVPVKYNLEARKMPASDFWSALKGHKIDRYSLPKFIYHPKGSLIKWLPPETEKHRVVSEALERKIEHTVSWVLNPLSHSHTVDRYRGEIEAAIFVIDELERSIEELMKPQRAEPKILLQQMLLSVLDGRARSL